MSDLATAILSAAVIVQGCTILVLSRRVSRIERGGDR